jgi:hypothetical protein
MVIVLMSRGRYVRNGLILMSLLNRNVLLSIHVFKDTQLPTGWALPGCDVV